jgi:hypothetical protein
MTVNIAAIEALFPTKVAVAGPSSGSFSPTTRGAFAYDAIMASGIGGFDVLLVGAIETVRAHPHWGPVYCGDLTVYGTDHSRADLALCGEFARLGLPGPFIDTAMRTSALYRQKWERDDYREHTIALALAGVHSPSGNAPSTDLLHPANGRVDASMMAPPARDWLIDGMLLSGKSAILAGLSGLSKTQLALQLSISAAIGALFAGRATQLGRVLFLSGEEDREELQRRINAVIRRENLRQSQIDLVRENLFAYPLVGADIRLTALKAGALAEASFFSQIIAAAGAHENLKLIVLDHAGLIHGGDFSAKQDAALTMRLVNDITIRTGAAVVLLAHSPKSAIQAEEADASMVFGSTAFVEQARGGWVMTSMTKGQAKMFAVSEVDRGRYVALTGVKANYTPVGQEFWFRRESFDEVGVLEHVTLVPSVPQGKGAASLQTLIVQAVGQSPGRYSKTGMRGKFQGKRDGPWKASKSEIEGSVDDLLQSGELITRPPTAEERRLYGHGSQVKNVLDVLKPDGPTA